MVEFHINQVVTILACVLFLPTLPGEVTDLEAPADAEILPDLLPDRLLQETLCLLDRLGHAPAGAAERLAGRSGGGQLAYATLSGSPDGCLDESPPRSDPLRVDQRIHASGMGTLHRR